MPVVTGDVGDRAEVLRGSAGVLVAPGSAAALAEGIAALLSDRERRARMAQAARARAADYRWDRLAEDWMRVYG